MASITILDASAVVAYFRNEDRADLVEFALGDPSNCYVHSVNLCEAYYDQIREAGEFEATQAMDLLLAEGIVERADMDPESWRRAAQIKAGGRVSLADCFCLSLAERLNGEVFTTDHGEFEPLGDRVTCKIRYIR